MITLRPYCTAFIATGLVPVVERLTTTVDSLPLMSPPAIATGGGDGRGRFVLSAARVARLFDFVNKTPSSSPHAVNLTDQLPHEPLSRFPFSPTSPPGGGEVGEKESLVGRFG